MLLRNVNMHVWPPEPIFYFQKQKNEPFSNLLPDWLAQIQISKIVSILSLRGRYQGIG